VRAVADARARQTLLLAQQRQHAEDDRHVAVQLHAHQAMRHRLADVLEVHRLAFDQRADGYDGVEGGC